MADIEGLKISQMTEKTELSGDELIPIIDGNENKTTKVRGITDTINEKLDKLEDRIERVFDGGRADSKYGGARVIDCGNASSIVE